jgi:hypothetical protein
MARRRRRMCAPPWYAFSMAIKLDSGIVEALGKWWARQGSNL